MLHLLQLQPILHMDGAPLVQRAPVIQRLGGRVAGHRGSDPLTESSVCTATDREATAASVTPPGCKTNPLPFSNQYLMVSHQLLCCCVTHLYVSCMPMELTQMRDNQLFKTSHMVNFESVKSAGKLRFLNGFAFLFLFTAFFSVDTFMRGEA